LVFLRVRGLRRAPAPEGGRLLRVLLLRVGEVPAEASRRDHIEGKIMDQKVRPSPRLAPLPIGHAPELEETFEFSKKTLAFVPNDVTDEMFAEMRKHWSENQIVEITAVVAYFGFLNRWNDTMGTPLEPEPTATGEKYLASHGWKIGKHARKARGENSVEETAPRLVVLDFPALPRARLE